MKTCSVEGCRGRYSARGYCAGHYAQWRKDPEGERTHIIPRGRKSEGCVISGCKRMHYCFGVCRTHYATCNNYGLSPVQLQRIFDGGCEICDSAEDIHIDHDHLCCPVGNGKKCGLCVRGGLCGKCNMAIGALGDNAHLLRRAANYVESTRLITW